MKLKIKLLCALLCACLILAMQGTMVFADETPAAEPVAEQAVADPAAEPAEEQAVADPAADPAAYPAADPASEDPTADTTSSQATWNIWGDTIAVEEAASEYNFRKSSDGADFVPCLTAYLLDDQSTVKGNVLVLSGGGDRMRSNPAEGIPCCEWLNSIGYNAFLLDYRVQPYETVDATLDVQRAIRYLKHYAQEKGIEKIENLAAMGFSAGAMHIYAESIMMSGNITPDSVYPDYVCDEVDAENADLSVVICVYAAGSTHDSDGVAIDISDPVMLLTEDEPNYPEAYPAYFFAGASGHFASGFCVVGYLALNPLTECELHMYGGITGPFAMGYDYAGSDQMVDQIEAFLDVQFGLRDRANK